MSVEPAQQSESHQHNIPPITASDTANWRVLIVDDVFDNISIAETILKLRGAEVSTATNGIEGLKVVDDFSPNLILLDLSMPEMDGWEMQQQLQQNPSHASIPVIALTAHAMQGDKERALAAGFDGYITKPFSIRTLVEDIQSILDSLDLGTTH